MPHLKILLALAIAGASGVASQPERVPIGVATALPAGNPLATAGDDVLQITGNARRAQMREFSQIRTFVSAYGRGGRAGNDKVTSYRAMVANPGSADAWTDNVLFHHVTNDPINTHLAEDDYDMLSANRYGTAVGPAGLSGGVLANGKLFPAGSAWGRMVTGISTAGGTITGAYGVAAAGKRAYFQRGFVCGFGTVQSCFEDDSGAQVGFRAHGANQDAFNSERANLKGAAVAMGQAQTITALDPSNARRIVAQLNGVNLVIGDRQTPRAFVMSVLHLANVPRCPNDSANSRASGGVLAEQDVCVTSGHQLMLAY